MRIHGRRRGRNIPGGEQVQDENVIVLYAPRDTVAALSGERGYGELAPCGCATRARRARRRSRAVRRYLDDGARASPASRTCPSVRAPGDWPGKAETEKFAQLLERDHACSRCSRRSS